MDVLSDLLQFIHLQSTVYFQSDFTAPFGMEMDASQVAQFHVVVAGNCYLYADMLEEPLFLCAGDVLMFPHGAGHCLADQANRQGINGKDVLRAYQDNEPLFREGEVCTRLLCGHFEFDREFVHPFLRDLPAMIYIPSNQTPAWLESAIQMIIQESDSDTLGANIIIDRLADVLFIQTIRAYLAQNDKHNGSLAALKDAQIKQSLRLIHEQPEFEWTLEQLAREVSMSRAAFANRFRELVGETPMRYITAWRMQKANRLLQSTNLTLAVIAEKTGYTSEASFSRAFKRQFSKTPGSCRKS